MVNEISKNNNLQNFITNNTDRYFTATKQIVNTFGDSKVVYSYFLRKNCLYAGKLVLNFINQVKQELNVNITIHELYKEGDYVALNTPMFFIEGSFAELSELETLILQKIGFPSIAAYNAYSMALTLPATSFISMGARHYSGSEMSNMIDYGILVGSNQAKKEGAKGFNGSSTKAGSSYFGLQSGIGTMPHSLIGYAESTLKAAQMYYEVFVKNNKDAMLVVLVDYFGEEITDTLTVCNYFPDLAKEGRLAVRLDTNGASYMQGLNAKESEDILNKYCNINWQEVTEEEKHHLVGKGVSGAAIYKMRETLNEAGFSAVKIVASSGFNLSKCQLMSKINAPIDMIGTGSVLGNEWQNSFATADIVSYNGKIMVKKGREQFANAYKEYLKNAQK